MKIPFRQGTVRYQQDSSGLPTFLQKSDLGSSIDFVAANEPTLFTIAHRKTNYLHEEAITVLRAWTNFKSGTDYWLYIDLDRVTGMRTFGHVKVEPTTSITPPARPVPDLHWFDVSTTTMKFWNGVAWIECIRIFVAKYESGAVINVSPLGSHVANNTVNDAGFILFGADGSPVRQNQNRTSFEFATTTTVFNTVTAKAVNLTLDSICISVKASEPLPEFSFVTRDPDSTQTSSVLLADRTKRKYHAIGMVQESCYTGDVGILTQQGYVSNEQWKFEEKPGTPIFLDETGSFATRPAQNGTLQRLGEVVNVNTIYIDIQPASRYADETSTEYKNMIPLVIDKVTGDPILAPDYYSSAIRDLLKILKDASKLPVTALGGPTLLLEEWMANFLSADDDLDRRIKEIEEALAKPVEGDYIRSIPTSISVGGVTIGTTFDGTVQDALDKILYPYGVPTFTSFSIRGLVALEVGATLARGVREFVWSTSNSTNILPNSITITDTNTGIILGSELENTGSASIEIPEVKMTKPGNYMWKIEGLSSEQGKFSRTFAAEWRWRVYYGCTDLEELTGADVLRLQNSSLLSSANGTFATPASGYKWLCYPSSFPTMKSFKDLATGLNIAINDPITVTVTSALGVVQSYKCHRTYNKLGGALTMVVS